MKKIYGLTICLVSGVIFLGANSCKQRNAVDYSTMHVYQPLELQKIVDNAYKIEKVGTPSTQKTVGGKDSTTTVITTQIYRVYVATTKDDHLIPISEVTTAARQAGGGPIIITSACEMTCTPVRPGEPCNISGCEESDKCGCSQGSCGNNCTTDRACHQSLAGFGFGRPIVIF